MEPDGYGSMKWSTCNTLKAQKYEEVSIGGADSLSALGRLESAETFNREDHHIAAEQKEIYARGVFYLGEYTIRLPLLLKKVFHPLSFFCRVP